MSKFLVVGRISENDNQRVVPYSGENMAEFQLISHYKRGNEIINFLGNLNILGLNPSELGLDLLVLALHVNVADRGISRKQGSQDNWTREIRIVVPVSNCEIWEKSKENLKVMLDFLTGDRWQIDFRHRSVDIRSLNPQLDFRTDRMADRVSLISGGLDSLIGAIDLCSKDMSQIFVSHADEYLIKATQDTFIHELIGHYSREKISHVPNWGYSRGKLYDNINKENSSRARSFLFFALAATVGSGLKNRDYLINVPENGLISLNVPLDSLRLGALSTRTTHPFYMARWNELLENIGIGGRLENPYWNKTKGEMVNNCADQELLFQLVAKSFSCSSPAKARWKGRNAENCGFCVPCIIRRSALFDTDPTTYTEQDLETEVLTTKRAVGQQIRSFQFAIYRLLQNRNLAKIFIHKTGPLTEFSAQIDEYADVYVRGIEEVNRFLEKVRTEPI